jgi:hypothetical protein
MSQQIINPNMYLRGCTRVNWFKVKDKNQDIFICGEIHGEVGNSIEFIKNLSDRVDCPIDVFIERSYSVEQVRTIVDSNAGRFQDEPYKTCLKKGFIPKQQDIRTNRQYYQTCVKEFKGRVKLWALDLRDTSIFSMLFKMIPPVHEFITSTSLKGALFYFYECLFNFEIFREDPQYYDERVRESIFFVLDIVTDPKDKSEIFRKISGFLDPEDGKKKDKTHMELARSLNHFPSHIVDFWSDTALHFLRENEMDLFYMTPLLDINVILRLFRLLNKQEEGIIIIFVGNGHLETISEMTQYHVSLSQINRTRFPIVEYKKTFYCSGKNRFKIPIPVQKCHFKTQRMKIFQQNQPSFQKQTKIISKTKQKISL